MRALAGRGASVFSPVFDDLRRFVEAFGQVADCDGVNEFLSLSSANGRGLRLLEIADVEKTTAGQELKRIASSRERWVTCKECAKIGDAVIALEQGVAFCLVHIDRAFKILCSATGRNHQPILSERASARQAEQQSE